jgi:hypothetical protein
LKSKKIRLGNPIRERNILVQMIGIFFDQRNISLGLAGARRQG